MEDRRARKRDGKATLRDDSSARKKCIKAFATGYIVSPRSRLEQIRRLAGILRIRVKVLNVRLTALILCDRDDCAEK